MTDHTDNLVLEHLRHLRTVVDRIEQNQKDMKTELVTIREYQAAAHTDSVAQFERMNNLEKRIQRIERPLELVDE
jgi:predicted  nucleic acid-binding Zn-ribbon protein